MLNKNNFTEDLTYNLLTILTDVKNMFYGENRFKVACYDTPKNNNNENQAVNEPIINAKTLKINDLMDKVKLCRKCLLSETRTQTVFGSGNFDSKVMIIGEAPGYDEDKQGFPFVGKAGQLLDKMLKAIDLTRDDVFICNILKCRPPNNRNPNDDEIKNCTSYLNEQINLINPKIIFTLGNFATQFILKDNRGITQLRGKTYNLDNRIILPTFHPSALLQNQNLKRPAWHDLKLLKLLLKKVNN
ncbi:MAG: uracil-DNA glycosylase [Spirochaetota bacterium]|nr:uracil-DNA glycosylase [Spirochaetota bacterium]